MTETEAIRSNVNYDSLERRSKKWIDPSFQKRYAILLLSIVALVSAVLIGTFWYHSEQVLQTLANAGVIKQHSLYLLIEKQMSSLLLSVTLVTSLFCVFVMVMARFLSHRIVGPIFRVKKSLEMMGEGRWDEARVSLRSDDEFQEVANLVNATVDRVRESKK